MLAADKKNITEIAIEIGIENMAHFYELFKRYAGCTPKQYKKNERGAKSIIIIDQYIMGRHNK